MDINELLKLNPNSECELKFTFTEEWKHCYYQLKNKSSPELDPNNLPVLDEEYSGDTGEPLLNDNDEEVFDPTQEIKYELYYEIEQSDIYKSKTFIRESFVSYSFAILYISDSFGCPFIPIINSHLLYV